MNLKELTTGTPVKLEIIRDSQGFEVATVVVGVSTIDFGPGSALLKPLSLNGDTLDLGSSKYGDVRYNLYTNNTDGDRICWNDVSISKKEFKGTEFYIATAKAHLAASIVNDRRANKRVVLHAPCTVLNRINGKENPAIIYDISDSGIAVFCDDSLRVDTPYQIKFTEQVNGTDYHLIIDCICVRIGTAEDKKLYGCKMTNASRDVVSYIYIKKLLLKAPM